MSWCTCFPTSRKLLFLSQALFVFLVAGSLIFGFTSIRPVYSWHPRLGSLRSSDNTTGPQGKSKLGGPPFSNTSTTAAVSSELKTGNATLLELASKYVKAITSPEDTSFERLSCPAPMSTRYDYLHNTTPAKIETNKPIHWKYFFALDLTQCIHILPRLLGSIIETIKFLGPQNCILSIVEGHSTDGTYEVLLSLRKLSEDAGIIYYLTTSDINPKGGSRIVALAKLRNLALQPLLDNASKATDTTILFINDVAICMEDILELIYQREKQSADMVCAMDWVYLAANPTFYDVWIARGMNGDTFFNIPPDGNWDSAWNIFWNNNEAHTSLATGQPFQVFSCWNGATAFTAKPFLESDIRFRAEYEGECPQGEPKSLCRDFWTNGYGKIAVVPSVNLEYSDEGGKKIKAEKGYVSDWVGSTGTGEEKIKWQKKPPEKVKCMPTYANQTWPEWDAPKGVKDRERGLIPSTDARQLGYRSLYDGPPHYRIPGLPR